MLGFASITVIAGLFGYYYAGLFERISIAAYLQWVLVIAIVFQKKRNEGLRTGKDEVRRYRSTAKY